MNCVTSLLAALEPPPQSSWAPVVLMIIIGIGFSVMTLAMSLWIGPRRNGPGKELTYESGVLPVGDTHRRFNVRFYIVAMIFLVFDVEIVFFYPWATIFPDAVSRGAGSGLLLLGMILFAVLLLLAYVYAWGKGVFEWD